jgi:hypothetical protein
MSHSHVNKANDSTYFFTFVGVACLVFGALISLYDLMYQPILSALLSLLFLVVGGSCSMIGVAGFLHAIDIQHFATGGECAKTAEHEPQNGLGLSAVNQ